MGDLFAVLDTNILVSALLTEDRDAATAQVVVDMFSGKFVPVFSKEILDEYNKVLRRKKFHFSEDTVGELIYAIERLGEFVIPDQTGEILPDRSDLPFYEAALAMQDMNGYLVTGNKKHFPKKACIVTAREFLDSQV